MSDYDLDEFDEEDWYCSECGCQLDPAGYCVCCDDIPDDWWDAYYVVWASPADESNNLIDMSDIPF